MPNLGPAEIILVLIVALLVFGPKKLPELGKSIGQGIREFRRGTSGITQELNASFKDEPVSDKTQVTSLESSFDPPASPEVIAVAAPVEEQTVEKQA